MNNVPELLIFLGKNTWRTPSELKQYAHDNAGHLPRLHFCNSDIYGVLISNIDGWITLVTNNGGIIHGWAGEFALA